MIKKEITPDEKFKYILYLLSFMLLFAGVIANIYLWEDEIIIPSTTCDSGSGFYNFNNKSCLTLINWNYGSSACISRNGFPVQGHCFPLTGSLGQYIGTCKNTCVV